MIWTPGKLIRIANLKTRFHMQPSFPRHSCDIRVRKLSISEDCSEKKTRWTQNALAIDAARAQLSDPSASARGRARSSGAQSRDATRTPTPHTSAHRDCAEFSGLPCVRARARPGSFDCIKYVKINASYTPYAVPAPGFSRALLFESFFWTRRGDDGFHFQRSGTARTTRRQTLRPSPVYRRAKAVLLAHGNHT